MSISSQNFESYLPVYDAVPEEWEEARAFLTQQLKEITNAVNVREIGFFLDQELLSGKQFIPSPNSSGPTSSSSQQFRTILRKVVNFGSLPNAGTKSIPHGINIDSNFTLIQLFASATDPTALTSLPIPFATQVIGQEIRMYLDSVNINIITAFNFSTYTRCFVVIEYIQEL